MAKAIGVSHQPLPFFQVQSKVKALEISLIVLGIMAFIGVAGLTAFHNQLLLPKAATIATATTMGVVGLVSFAISFYLKRTFTNFFRDHDFYNSYPTFSRFNRTFKWDPFQRNEIDASSPILKHYRTQIFNDIEARPQKLICTLYLYSSHASCLDPSVQNRDSFKFNLHYLAKILHQEPERLKNAILKYLKLDLTNQNRGGAFLTDPLLNAKCLMAMFPEDIIKDLGLDYIEAYLNQIQGNKDRQSQWVNYLA